MTMSNIVPSFWVGFVFNMLAFVFFSYGVFRQSMAQVATAIHSDLAVASSLC